MSHHGFFFIYVMFYFSMEIGNNGYYNEHFRRYPKPCNGKV